MIVICHAEWWYLWYLKHFCESRANIVTSRADFLIFQINGAVRLLCLVWWSCLGDCNQSKKSGKKHSLKQASEVVSWTLQRLPGNEDVLPQSNWTVLKFFLGQECTNYDKAHSAPQKSWSQIWHTGISCEIWTTPQITQLSSLLLPPNLPNAYSSFIWHLVMTKKHSNEFL